MEQLERTHRYLDRMRTAYSGVPYREDGRDYYADDVHSFFVHCHHIGDWIVTLNNVGVTREDVTAFVNSHVELRICADLCNGTKHCRVKRIRTSRQPHVAGHRLVSTGSAVDPGDGVVRPVSTRCQFEILAEGEFRDALDLAERCMSLWDDFVSRLDSAS